MARLANQMKQLYAMCATALVMAGPISTEPMTSASTSNCPSSPSARPPSWPTFTPRLSVSTTASVWFVRSAPMAAHAATACATLLRLNRAQRLSQDEGHQPFRYRAHFGPRRRESPTAPRSQNACKPATRRAFSPQAVTAISWRYNAPTAPASGATPSAAKPANCPAAILPPISLPAPPATPTTLPPTPSPWSCGVG